MTNPRRHWSFRFSLLTLLTVVTILCCAMAAVALEINAVRHRTLLLDWCAAQQADIDICHDIFSGGRTNLCFSAPPRDVGWIKRALGDPWVSSIYFETPPSRERQLELANAFPEAELAWWTADQNLQHFGQRTHGNAEDSAATRPAPAE